jgi:methyltransferase-like protein
MKLSQLQSVANPYLLQFLVIRCDYITARNILKLLKPITAHFSERLGIAMQEKAIKHSPTVLANLFNSEFSGKAVTPHSARNWMLGNVFPTQDKLEHLAKLLDTSAEYLRYGRHSEKTFAISNEDGSETVLTSAQQQFVKRYLSLSKVQQRIINSTVAEFTEIKVL